MKKIEQIKKEIAETQEKIDSIHKLKTESQGERSKAIERLKQITQELKKCYGDKNHAIAESKGLRTELREHRTIVNELRQNLKNKNIKDANFIPTNQAELDEDIKYLDNKLHTGTHNGQDERALVNQIDSKKRVKKELKDLAPRIERILILEPKVDLFTTQIDSLSERIIELKEEEAKIRASDSTLDVKPGDGQRARNPVLDELYEKKRELNEQKKKLQEGYYDVKQQVKEAKQKWIDEDKEKRRLEKEQKKQELDKYYDEKRKKREERVAEEEKQVPMEDELEISNRLIQLLESFLPAQPVKQDDPLAPKEPLVSKGRGAKKPKGNDINYQWQDYAAFERVSLTPPIKRELIPKAIEDLKAKREHYKNMQEEFKKTQATKKTAQEEAAKKAVEEKTTQKSLVNTENPAPAVSTSTVTEEKPATTPAPSTEHNATEKPQEAAQA